MKKVFRKIRVLMILPTFNLCGGIENFLMSYYRQLKDKVDFDIITHEMNETNYKEEVEKNGDHVYCLPKYCLSNIVKVHNNIKEFFKEHHDYDIIHCNMVNAAYIYLKEAKKYGIKCRIMHSHQNKYSDKLSHSLRNMPLVAIGKRYTNGRIACSYEAGKFLFKNKEFTIIRNAIDSKKFTFNNNIRIEIRERLGLKDEFVIGSIGRFMPAKNQSFLIDVFNELQKKERNSKLILIGDGELKEKLVNKSKRNKSGNNIFFIGTNDIIYKYLQAFDVFVLPSLYEGLGIVNVEAQTAGLHTIVSTNIPKEAEINRELIHFIPLEKGPEYWANYILKFKNYKRTEQLEEVVKHGYDIHSSANDLYEFYKEMIREEENK